MGISVGMSKHTTPELHQRRLTKLSKIIQRLEKGSISKSDKQDLQIIAGHYGVDQPTCSVENMYLTWAKTISGEISSHIRSLQYHPAAMSTN